MIVRIFKRSKSRNMVGLQKPNSIGPHRALTFAYKTSKAPKPHFPTRSDDKVGDKVKINAKDVEWKRKQNLNK